VWRTTRSIPTTQHTCGSVAAGGKKSRKKDKHERGRVVDVDLEETTRQQFAQRSQIETGNAAKSIVPRK
jgi:hypothetical protein